MINGKTVPAKKAANMAYIAEQTVYRWLNKGYLDRKFVLPGQGYRREELDAEDFATLLVIKYCVRYGASMRHAADVAAECRTNFRNPYAFIILSTHGDSNIRVYMATPSQIERTRFHVEFNGPEIDTYIPLEKIYKAATSEVNEA